MLIENGYRHISQLESASACSESGSIPTLIPTNLQGTSLSNPATLPPNSQQSSATKCFGSEFKIIEESEFHCQEEIPNGHSTNFSFLKKIFFRKEKIFHLKTL